MLETLLEPLQYSFMQRSLIVAIIIGIICAVVGSYLMVQRMALLGDAISHSVLPGLAIALLEQNKIRDINCLLLTTQLNSPIV